MAMWLLTDHIHAWCSIVLTPILWMYCVYKYTSKFMENVIKGWFWCQEILRGQHCGSVNEAATCNTGSVTLDHGFSCWLLYFQFTSQPLCLGKWHIDGFPRSWLPPGMAPAVATTWWVNQRVKDSLSFSLFLSSALKQIYAFLMKQQILKTMHCFIIHFLWTCK